MIQTLRFANYRVLRDAELPLGPFTLLVGPNGSGKSTVLHALRSLRSVSAGGEVALDEVHSFGDANGSTALTVTFEGTKLVETTIRWEKGGTLRDGHSPRTQRGDELSQFLRDIGTYSFDEKRVIQPVQLTPHIGLREDGGNLEVAALAPEFDRVLFDTPAPGNRGFMLRTRVGQHPVPARNLSQGTVLALALLALTYLEPSPSMICIEEPDRGIHPRLYREIQDALYRLAYPTSFGLDRPPVQVLITSHSPYMLDLHRDHPEEVVIAEKVGSEATFTRLSEREDLEDLLSEASLGEVWYSGVLGGVPAGT
jgi:predicted ATPase